MAKMTIGGIIKKFLKIKLDCGMTEIPNHVIETQLPGFGMSMFQIMHSPGSYSRIFRMLVRDGEVKAEEVKNEYSKEKHWKILEVKL